ncbi:SMI1/KNR4 family protein [Salipaludibacillus sp. LMS25]|jgi:hypothetical protein|uniref:SMI1/KNR4 family protein n=1 Tax=Salipaludibacillus sp. LMS25 TaxID=2924031 RepID=UPI0020D0AB27|nr:SMI1/KNR4 family protein [Salipaludibacillus sp. LMS25]UTR14133.1 SMI1/KNR4 family protein [Salipaludibacillus sp. LMS25]
MCDWKENIATMVLVKQELMEIDKENLWPHHFPEVAASDKDIESLELQLGYDLDPIYRGFLKYANGWKGFYQTIRLFGTKELNQSIIMKYAQTLLGVIEDDVLNESQLSRYNSLPIAATSFDKDLFVLGMPNSEISGKVIWFAGEEIDRFENFNEFFLAMIDFNRNEILALK